MRAMRTACVAAVLGAAIGIGSGAFAADLPKQKAGLWEMSLRMTGMNMPPQVTKYCADGTSDASSLKPNQGGGRENCSRNDIQRNGNVVTIDSVCKADDMTMTSHTVMTFNGDSGYTATTQARMDPPMPGHGEMNMTQEARWAGPCPAGMQPGDMIAPNGMKMNRNPAGH